MSKLVSVIDYGTSKIACVTAQASNDGTYDVIGYGCVPYAGYDDGQWNEPTKLPEVTQSVLQEAGIIARKKIRKIYVSVPGDYTQVFNYRVSTDILSADRRVTQDDIQKLVFRPPAPDKKSTLALLHRKPVYYTLDAQDRIYEPLGERTTSVSAMISMIHADKRFLSQVNKVMDYIGVDTKGYVSSVIGQSSYMIPKQERERGCVLIDTGFATTTVSLLQGNGILYMKTIPFGAKQIIMDMMEELNIPYTEADTLKRRYVFGLDNQSGQMQLMQVMDRTDKARTYQTSLLTEVIEGRMDEIIKEIDNVITQSGFQLANHSIVYLTGGGFAMMNGIRQYASSILKRNVQVLLPQSPRINNAVYANVLGALDYICARGAEQNAFGMVQKRISL